MEKPRKKDVLDRTQTIIHGIRAFASYGVGARIYGDGVDDIHLQRAITAAKEIEAMSAWIEGELPSESEINECLLETKRNYEALTTFENVRLPVGCDGSRLYAKAIHALLTRKLKGEV